MGLRRCSATIGGLIDRFGPRKLLGLGLFSWSLAQAAGGLVTGFGVFIAARPRWASAKRPCSLAERAWCAIGSAFASAGSPRLLQSASSLGNFIAVPLLTFLMLRLSWRWMFLIVGAAGVLLAFVWWSIHRDPSEVRLTPDEHPYLTEGDENTTSSRPPLPNGRTLRSPNHMGYDRRLFWYGLCTWVYTSWLPYYLEHERHMSVARVGIVGRNSLLLRLVGAVVGGWLCDFLTRRGWTPIGGRKVLLSSALCGISLCIVGTVLAVSNAAAIAFISVTLFLIYIAASAAWATVPIAAPSQYTASLGSIQNCGGYLGGALAPAVTGLIVEHTGSFSQALLLSAALSALAAVAYLLLVRQPIQPDRKRTKPRHATS